MSKASELNGYIVRVRRTLQLRASLQGLVILSVTALLCTLLLVAFLNRYAFPMGSVSKARLLLMVGLAIAAALGLVWPLLRLSRDRAVRLAEAAYPSLEGSLTTFHQRQQANADPFLELLAADTLVRAQQAPASRLAPPSMLLGAAATGLACLGILVWMILAAPGYMGYGASLLWTGAKKTAEPLYALTVTPGDVAVRRHSDQLITAEVTHLHPGKVQLIARFNSATSWEPVAMQPQVGTGSRYGFVFAGLPENVEYFVIAGPLTSPHYKVRVVDLPSIKSVKVTYHFPKWTGLAAQTADHAGDLRAIEGTQAEVQIEMDRTLQDGNLTLDSGQIIHLAAGEGNHYTGTLPMTKDGSYHVAATDNGQAVRLSEDYFIATDKAAAPQIALDKPGHDYRASPIEEVTLHVKASAQFGLRDMHLHYSVNGGPDKDMPMLKQQGAHNADGSFTLRLEDFKLQAGDLISVYATAKDGHAEAKTDISFIQAEPFEREFSQSQQGGGGGDSESAGNQTDISKREKELIAETWKEINNKGTADKTAKAQGSFLGEAQSKLRNQVTALSTRINSRDLSSANVEFTAFEKDMQEAAKNMLPATEKLNGMRWQEALQSEQKALQALLRAEATFRQIQVAFGQQQGGGGAGSSSGRDLASLFDLELDTAKNQYETAKMSSAQEQKAKDVEDALAKLDALAKRQEELADKQKNPQQALQERWQQEMLRREAEQLQRQMEQLATNKQEGQPDQQGQSGQQGQPASQGSQGASTSRGNPQAVQGGSQQRQSLGQQTHRTTTTADQRIEQALNRMKSAEDAMKRSGGTQGNTAEAQRQAAEQLREATGLMGGAQQDLAGNTMGSMSHEADRLQTEERAQSERFDQYARSGNLDANSYKANIAQRNQFAADRQELAKNLSRLQRNMRDSARQMASSQPETSQKLRDALTEIDKADLDNHVQRTVDWLRSGINPNSNGMERRIADDIARLGQKLHAAQQTLGKGSAPGGRTVASGKSQQTAALGQVERLRSQLEAMQSGRANNRSSERNDQQPTTASNGKQGALNSVGHPGGQQSAGAGLGQERAGQGQPAGRGSSQDQQAGSGRGSLNRGRDSGTSNQPFGTAHIGTSASGQQRGDAKGTDGTPTDTDQTFQQSLRELQALRGMVKGNAEATKEVAELGKQMQGLDPSRYPGNPALVEQMHTDVLRTVDKLELQLQRFSVTDARMGKSDIIPAGYNDSVADYYRRLSKGR